MTKRAPYCLTSAHGLVTIELLVLFAVLEAGAEEVDDLLWVSLRDRGEHVLGMVVNTPPRYERGTLLLGFEEPELTSIRRRRGTLLRRYRNLLRATPK